jgi:hypothetical protein
VSIFSFIVDIWILPFCLFVQLLLISDEKFMIYVTCVNLWWTYSRPLMNSAMSSFFFFLFHNSNRESLEVVLLIVECNMLYEQSVFTCVNMHSIWLLTWKILILRMSYNHCVLLIGKSKFKLDADLVSLVCAVYHQFLICIHCFKIL